MSPAASRKDGRKGADRTAQSIALGLLALTMVLLASNRVRIDLVGLLVLVLAGLSGLVPASRLYAGFSSEAVVLIGAMLAVGEGLRRSGVTDALARWLEGLGRRRPHLLRLALLALPPLPSAFISDVGLMAILLPTAMRLREGLDLPPGRTLMPLAIAIALGGLLTMVGSAGNILANAALGAAGLPQIGLFAITPLGLLLTILGLGFLLLAGQRWLPAGATGEFVSDYGAVKEFLSEIRVLPGSPLAGRPLAAVPYFRQHHVTIVRILRGDHTVVAPGGDTVLQAGDRLLVHGSREAVLTLTDSQGLEAVRDRDPATRRLREGEAQVVEAVVPSGSRLTGRTLRAFDFRTRYGATVLAIYRQGSTLTRTLGDIRLQAGDILLLEGPPAAIRRLDLERVLVVLGPAPHAEAVPAWKGGLAVALLAVLLGAAAAGLLPVTLAATLVVTGMVLAGIVSLGQIYRAVDWRILLLVGGLTPLGTALVDSGLTARAVHALVAALSPYGPLAVTAAFFWLAALLTQVISNVATALVLSPVAIGVARLNHWSPDPLLMAMVVALSAAPLTPLANKVFLMTMTPGGYRYADYLRVGLPLTLLVFAASLWLIPVFFPFSAA
ncbi:MAG: SLC13 family permease [Firmicutes bacterium]|nr:SLC13 family permease [Bacillota bacterium]